MKIRLLLSMSMAAVLLLCSACSGDPSSSPTTVSTSRTSITSAVSDTSKTIESTSTKTAVSPTGTTARSQNAGTTAPSRPGAATTKSTLSKKEQEELRQKLIDAIDDLKESE